MPWVDVIIVLLITIAAFIGYNVGLLGAFKGFVSSIVGLVAAWILAPIAQAWLETKWGVESFLTELVGALLPAQFKEMVQVAAQAAHTLQDFRDNLLTAMPPEMALYLQRVLNRSPLDAAFSPTDAVDAITGEIAQCIMWAFLFLLIWLILSILIKGFLSMIFISKDGKTIIGVFDGVLGMVAMTAIVVMAMIVCSGLLYPLMLFSRPDGSLARLYPQLLNSRLISWMASIYQLYLVR